MAIKRSVSLYSLQDEYATGRMNREDMFIALEEMGADLEFITDQMMHDTPFPHLEALEEWDGLVKKYNVKPICNDVFINYKLYKNRTLTRKENLDLLIHEIKLANRLGFPMIRLVSETPANIIEDALPYAEKYNVILALEIHAAMSFDHPLTMEFTDIMFKLNSPYLGVVVDTGIFCRRMPRIVNEFFLDQGLNPKIVDFIEDIFKQGKDPIHVIGQGYYGAPNGPKYPEALVKLLGSDIDRQYSMFSCAYENSPIEILDKYLPYIRHFHGKIYEMVDGIEYSIDFEELVKYLTEKKWNGYISTEYEGNRFTLERNPVDGIGQVRSHQKLLKALIDKYENGGQK